MKLLRLATLLLVLGGAGRLHADTVIVFNEVMYHPAANEAAMEWVELHNQMTVDVDMSDWALTGGIDFTFPEGTILEGGAYLIVALDPAALSAATGVSGALGPFTGRLSNNGDTLRLRDNSGRVLDELDYGVEDNWPVGPDGAGVSLAKQDPDTASGPAANWSSSSQIGGTPGQVNFPPGGQPSFPPGLVSYWNMDEGGSATDLAGLNFGALGAGVTFSGGSGINGAYLFNGQSAAFVNVGPGADDSFSVSAGLTLEAVVIPGWDGTGTETLFEKSLDAPQPYVDEVMGDGPLAYWRMDDQTATITDATANGHNGAADAPVLLNQSSLLPSDPTGNAVRATGASRIVVPGFEKIGPGGYTVEFWVRVHTLPVNCCQNLVGDGFNANDFFLMNYIVGPQQGQVGAIRPHFSFDNTPVSMDSTTLLQVNQTYHVVTTWDATSPANNAVIYINGQADRVGTVTQNVPAPGGRGSLPVYIGSDNREPGDGSYTYDEVAIYNYALTSSDVSRHYQAGVVTDFETTQGNALRLAFQNDGNNANAMPPVAAGPVVSFGMVVNGIYSELDMPLDGQAGRPTLAELNNGQPHHIAATYNASTGAKAIHVDGTVRFSAVLGGLPNTANAADAILGNARENGAAPYGGTLDEVAFWNRALSDAEVLAHATSIQSGQSYFNPSTQSFTKSLAFSEVGSGTNSAAFFVEIVNDGNGPVNLNGHLLLKDGLTDAEYVFMDDITLDPGELLSLSAATLGFSAVTGDKLVLYPPQRDRVLDGVVVKDRTRAREAAGKGVWRYPDAATPGAANSFSFAEEIVINEIMYHAPLLPPTNGLPPVPSREAWVELFNKGDQPVDLTGWRFDGGIDYQFADGTMLGSGAYLVVAEDAAALSAKYPGITIVGNYSGNLSGKSDRLVLEDAFGNPADIVEYYDGGNWPEYADGGGSSLELKDPASDNARAESWAGSDENDQTSWQNYSYRMVAAVPTGSGQPTQWQDFVLGLLSGGECLIDDISVVENPDGTAIQVIGNGGFSSGITGWRPVGTHGGSGVIPDPDDPGNNVLRVVATGPQEHMHNHIETTLAGGRTIQPGAEYEVSYRARWRAGNNLLNTRLYFNRVARTMALPTPTDVGTPGAPNSAQVANLGPTFTDLRHEPVIPAANQDVTVTVRAADPQGVASATLWWSAEGAAWTSAAMTDLGGGLYEGNIPGYTAGSRVQFHVQAQDTLGAMADFPADGRDSGALYAVQDGQANLALSHNVRIILSPANTALLHAFTNVQSNARLPGTVIYDEKRAYYNVGVRLKGSERGRYSAIRVSYHLTFPPDDPFRGVHPVMLVDRSGAGDSTANKQQEILIKHILNRAGGIPGLYTDIIRVIAPQAAQTESALMLPRFEDEFIETAYANGGDGNIWELELIYYPTTANASGYKNPNPDAVIGTDIRDLGDDKEIYRYNFIIKKERDRDDYAPFMTFAKTFSQTGELLESQTEQVMDMDEWTRAFALIGLCGVGDTYTFGNIHNLLMYLRPSDGRFLAFPWDMDFSFNRGTSEPIVRDHNLTAIINRPRNLRRLYGHVQDIIAKSFNQAYITPWAAHYQSFAPGQNYGGVPGYVGARANYALNLINSAGGNAAFAINGAASIEVSNNLARLTGTAPVAVQEIMVNGVRYQARWTGISTWQLEVPLETGTNVLTLVGLDVRGEPLPTHTAAVSVNNTGTPEAPEAALVFNELHYHPTVPESAFVELFNRSATTSFDLSGWRINGLDYTFPGGSVLTNGQHLVLAESRTGFLNAFQANAPAPFDVFDGRLDLDGETLSLQQRIVTVTTNAMSMGETNETFVDVDKVRYEAVLPWAEGPNGGGSSLELVDADEDNSRVSNWKDGAGWLYFSRTSVAGVGASRLIFAMAQAGDVYIDDVKLVLGTEAGVGENIIVNGDFESGDIAPWQALRNHSNTVVTTEVAYEGTRSLHIIAEGQGSTQDLLQQFFPSSLVSTETYTLSFRYLPTTSNNLKYRVSGVFLDFLVGIPVVPTMSSPGSANNARGDLPAYDPVWLNEAAPENTAGLLDGAGDADPWVELYNAGSVELSLDGYYLANNYDTNLVQWAFPAGASILPGEYKVVWVDGEPGETSGNEWHASFRLDAGSGNLALVREVQGAPQVTDYLTWSLLPAGESYGDFPDGQPFQRITFSQQTPGAANIGSLVDLFINEWLAGNTAGLQDPADGDFADWFEIYNAGAETVDLSGYFLTDNFNDKDQFIIPPGFSLPAGGHLLVWADNDPEQSDALTGSLHVNFALGIAGESIGLYTPQGIRVDEVTFGPQTNNISQGRFPDGAAALEFMVVTTPGAANVLGGDNNAPILDPVADSILYLGQSLNAVLTANDADLPGQTLTFGLLPGAPAGMTLTTAGPNFGLLAWTPSEAQAPSTNLVTAVVTDNGVPMLSDQQAFTIIVLEPPVVGISVAGGQVTLSLPAVPGRSYQVWFADELGDPVNWQTLGDPVVATGETLVIMDDVGAETQRFYRVEPL